MTSNMFSRKTALIIGGSSMIGKETARLLLSHGAEVFLADWGQESLDATVRELSDAGIIRSRQIDLTHDYEVDVFMEELETNYFGKIDFLVSAAGPYFSRSFVETTLLDYDNSLDVNRGLYFVTQCIVKKMKLNGGGVIVNISSFWARSAIGGMPVSAFSMAKAGLEAFTKQLSVELAVDKIRVNAIVPGMIESSPSGMLNRRGYTAEIASAVGWLLSDDAAGVTGAVWEIDGGMGFARL